MSGRAEGGADGPPRGRPGRPTAARGPIEHEGWTTHVSSGLALAGFLLFAFCGFTLLAIGPLRSIDAYFNVQAPPRPWVPFLHVLDRIGQRAVCLPVLVVAIVLACRRVQSWRPAVVAGLSVFMLNLVVLVLKLALGRDEPVTADPSFFHGGMAYPSGHTSNIVLVYGLATYLLGWYGVISRRASRLLWTVVALLSFTMVVTSLTLTWHWFADLVAGLLVGGMVLQLTESLNALVPTEPFEHGVLRSLRVVARWAATPLRPRRTTPSEAVTVEVSRRDAA